MRGGAGAPLAPPPPIPPQRNTDPVIQMLAEKAAHDADLKDLMRIVANGEATPEQLKRFQAHIDDLSRLHKAQQAAQASLNQMTALHPVKTGPATAAPLTKAPMPHYQAQPTMIRSKAPAPASAPAPHAVNSTPLRSEYSGICLEFAHAPGERCRFPAHSILEYMANGQILASFLVVRRGSAADSPLAYDANLEYYQPVTARIYIHQGRLGEVLARTVKSRDVVRHWMDAVMDRATRADVSALALRLPRPDTARKHSLDHQRLARGNIDDDDDDGGVLWRTHVSDTLPLTGRRARRVCEDAEERYQAFVRSIASRD